ncbi:MAG: YrdB family protein [Anaerolineae bacterium]
MQLIKWINLGLRFLLELGLLAALGYWGFTVGGSMPAKIGLGLGAPLLAALVWGVFLAPASARRLVEPWRLLAELVIFGGAVAALISAGAPTVAWVFGILVVLNKILMLIWRQ